MDGYQTPTNPIDPLLYQYLVSLQAGEVGTLDPGTREYIVERYGFLLSK